MLKDLNQAEQRFLEILEGIPFLQSVVDKLAAGGVRYGFYSGSLVALADQNRTVRDIDILVQDDDMLKVRALFPFAHSKDIGNGAFLYIGPQQEVELVSYSDIRIGDYLYRFRLTDLAWANTLKFIIGKKEYNVLNPVDTILIKAMLQRGSDQGKRDLEDIRQLIDAIEINHDYLKKRLVEINANERVYKILRKYNVLLKEY